MDKDVSENAEFSPGKLAIYRGKLMRNHWIFGRIFGQTHMTTTPSYVWVMFVGCTLKYVMQKMCKNHHIQPTKKGRALSNKRRDKSIYMGKLLYNMSLAWSKAIWGWFPSLTMIPVRSQWYHYWGCNKIVNWETPLFHLLPLSTGIFLEGNIPPIIGLQLLYQYSNMASWEIPELSGGLMVDFQCHVWLLEDTVSPWVYKSPFSVGQKGPESQVDWL